MDRQRSIDDNIEESVNAPYVRRLFTSKADDVSEPGASDVELVVRPLRKIPSMSLENLVAYRRSGFQGGNHMVGSHH